MRKKIGGKISPRASPQKKPKSLFKETISTKVKKQDKFSINLEELGNGWNRNAPT